LSQFIPEEPRPQVPADYYCAPVAESERLFPRWVPLGCGTASLVMLILLFIGGAFANRGGATRLVDWGLVEMQQELIDMCDRDVKPEQKTNFTAEVSTLRDRMRAQKVKADELVSLLQSMRETISDEQVSPAELDELTKKIHAINTGR
jgi:hypothetical protein